MDRELHYASISVALEELRKKGFTIDYNLASRPDNFDPEHYSIVDIYRYEGNTDPADEAVVYAIESSNGDKGVLVSGYGSSSDIFSESVLINIRRSK